MKSCINKKLFLFGIIILYFSSCCCYAEEADNDESERNVLTYEEKYEKALNDEDTFIKTVYTSKLGSNIVRGSGSLSALSSIILMLIIHRSRIGLSTIYHRIMYCMSIADIVSSIAMALASLPMPKDMIYTQFESGVYGNAATCTAQGIAFFLGSNIVFAYNASLCVYYLCAIRYKMTESCIRKRVEPFFQIGALLCSLPITMYVHYHKLYNPNPWDAWCTATGIPWQCSYRENAYDDCFFHGNVSSGPYYFTIGGYLFGFTCLLGSMILIILSVYRQEMLQKTYMTKVYGRRARTSRMPNASTESNNLDSSRSRHHFTKIAAYQALAYLAVFLLCQSNVFISLFSKASTTLRKNEWTQIHHLVTRPLQGFFNLLVFVCHKIYNLRMNAKELTVSQAFVRVFTVREEPRYLFSQISMVAGIRNDDDEEEDEFLFEGDDDNEDEIEGESRLYPFPEVRTYGGDDASSGISFKTEDEGTNRDMMADIDLSISDPFEENSGGKTVGNSATASNSSGNKWGMTSSSGFSSGVFSAQSSRRSDLSLDTRCWFRNKSSKE
jgi:hypothetical protein